MFNQQKILSRARSSSFWRGILNWSLNRMIPFNEPHGFSIEEIDEYRIRTRIPYKRRNLNHIRGLHACALATASEFTSGFLLVSRLDAKKYRLIMKRLEMDYHYQGKMEAYAEFAISDDWLKTYVYEPLEGKDAVEVTCEVKIFDAQGNHLTTGNVYWHVKDWAKVKTKVNG